MGERRCGMGDNRKTIYIGRDAVREAIERGYAVPVIWYSDQMQAYAVLKTAVDKF